MADPTKRFERAILYELEKLEGDSKLTAKSIMRWNLGVRWAEGGRGLQEGSLRAPSPLL